MTFSTHEYVVQVFDCIEACVRGDHSAPHRLAVVSARWKLRFQSPSEAEVQAEARTAAQTARRRLGLAADGGLLSERVASARGGAR